MNKKLIWTIIIIVSLILIIGACSISETDTDAFSTDSTISSSDNQNIDTSIFEQDKPSINTEELSLWGKKLQSLGINPENEKILFDTLPNVTKLDKTNATQCFLARQKIGKYYEEYYVSINSNGDICKITTTDPEYKVRTVLYPKENIDYRDISLSTLETDFFLQPEKVSSAMLYSYVRFEASMNNRFTIANYQDSVLFSELSAMVSNRPEQYIMLCDVPLVSNAIIEAQIIAMDPETNKILFSLHNIVDVQEWE